MSAAPVAPEFSAFRPRVRVELSPTLTLICYAPTLDEGLRAEQIVAASLELRDAPDPERESALGDEMEAQVWALIVGVEIRSEAGEILPTPDDWREQLWSTGAITDQQGSQAWSWLFRRSLGRGLRRGAPGRGGSAPRPAAAGGSERKRGAKATRPKA